MSQVDVGTSIGYSLKRVTSALRSAMDAGLQDHQLTVSQYAVLELLAQRPGLSNAELARGVFVSRQATHQLLTGLKQAGLIDVTGSGREQRLALTGEGVRRLRGASETIASVEEHMLGALDDRRRRALRESLSAMAQALEAEPT